MHGCIRLTNGVSDISSTHGPGQMIGIRVGSGDGLDHLVWSGYGSDLEKQGEEDDRLVTVTLRKVGCAWTVRGSTL
ncbi:hypothetical protein LWI28_022793 [Acer negundo]|uniref:Uncharacterized protein n=1 Tax=Acer negundo TaxID=4023 RepID=A0AAD5I7T6_ACENE|nr:hypothetical protein LWI28_022793 [Acer negundo]